MVEFRLNIFGQNIPQRDAVLPSVPIRRHLVSVYPVIDDAKFDHFMIAYTRFPHRKKNTTISSVLNK